MTLCITGSQDGTANLWNVADGTLIHTFPGPLDFGHQSIAFSPDGTIIATSGGQVKVWNSLDFTLVRTLSAFGPITFSPDGTKLLSGGYGAAVLWNVADGTTITSFATLGHYFESVAFSPDGTKVLTASNDSQGTSVVKLWTVADGTEIYTVSDPTHYIYSVAYSPNGSTFATASGVDWFSPGSVKLWNAEDGTLQASFSGHTSYVNSVAFSPDGTQILTASGDLTARLWQAMGTADKAILVAGGGDYVGNPIVGQTQALGDQAFFTCLVRGYPIEDIMYLSAFDDWQTRDSNGDGRPDADAPATAQNFWQAVDSWSSDTARLFIYLLDHGTYDVASGRWSFFLNETESITASELDTHLDALQAQTGGEVILVVDCCFSGGFVQQCRATTGTRRIVISSTTPEGAAIFSPPVGAESFSFYFLSFAILGNTLDNCFRWSRLSFASMGYPAGQVPWMDDNGDGASDKWDGDFAARQVLGRYPAFGLRAPTILDVRGAVAAVPGEGVALWADVQQAVTPQEVWAMMIPASATYDPNDPVTDLTRVDLSPGATPNRWESNWTAPTAPGTYRLTYFALSEDSLGTRLVATPHTSSVFVHHRTRATIPWSLFE